MGNSLELKSQKLKIMKDAINESEAAIGNLLSPNGNFATGMGKVKEVSRTFSEDLAPDVKKLVKKIEKSAKSNSGAKREFKSEKADLQEDLDKWGTDLKASTEEVVQALHMVDKAAKDSFK